MNIRDYFAQHPVFTYEEFVAFQKSQGARNLGSIKALLHYYIKKGRLTSIRRGLYASIPYGYDIDSFPVEPYLIAAKVTEDAIIAYHTALEYHGSAYSIFHHFYFMTAHQIKPFFFQTETFISTLHPKILLEKKHTDFEINTGMRFGHDERVTSIERTLVDVLTKPEVSGGWEEVWRSLELVPVFNIDKVIEYALLLENNTTVAKVGYFFESTQEQFGTTDEQLKELEKHCPKQPHYIDRSKPSTMLKRWNLIVPDEIIEKRWEEPFV